MMSDGLRQNLTALVQFAFSPDGRAMLFNPPEKILDTAGDINTIFGLIKAVNNAYLDVKAQCFIRGLASACDVTLRPDEVAERLRDPRVMAFVATTINDAILAQSLKAVALLGMIAADIITREQDVRYQDQVAIAALRIMFDDDFENFIRVVEYVQDHRRDDINPTNFRVTSIVEKSESDRSPFEFELTFEKLKSVQAVNTGNISDGFSIGISSPWGKIGLSPLSDHLYNLIIEAQTRNLIALSDPIPK